MNILVTGAAGFLGSHVVDALLAAKHEVLGVDNLSTGKREWCAAPCLTADFSAVTHGDPDVIVHCAAVADISQNWAKQHNRDAIYATNIDSLIVFLERLPATVKRFVFVSTAAVTAPQVSPYTASKIAGEALCKAYCQRRGIGLTIVRPVSMLGPRYHHGHIADFVRTKKRDGHITAEYSLGAYLPYAHVTEVARLLRGAAEDISDFCGTVTVPGRRWQAWDTVVMLEGRVFYTPDERPADPQVDAFESGSPAEWVQETIDWCQEHLT